MAYYIYLYDFYTGKINTIAMHLSMFWVHEGGITGFAEEALSGTAKASSYI